MKFNIPLKDSQIKITKKVAHQNYINIVFIID